ncbi:MAG: hormogonium polysaccharide biosynthesis glycosyltransferase HpsE [Cyanobacteria bacterium J06632_3]
MSLERALTLSTEPEVLESNPGQALQTLSCTYQLTVAICTYNGAQRLPTVLDCLRHQITPDGCRWEILIIDNNSSDDTAAVVEAYQQNWPDAVSLRYCFEPRQGTAYARQRAITQARSELVGFIDDDNLPAESWVTAACAFASTHPTVGAFGSRINGQFESPLPPNFERIQPFFAITHRGSQAHRYERKGRVLPPAAGLVVRRQVWLDHVPTQLHLLGAKADHRLAGEDLEALSYIQKTGWEIWHNPAMEIDHYIPDWRLERTYLMSFFRSIGLSRYVTRMLRFSVWHRPFGLLLYVLNDSRKVILHLLRYRRTIQTDIVAACEWQLFLSTLVSPLYFLGKLWRSRAIRE